MQSKEHLEREAEKNGACAVGIDFSYCYNINELNKIHFKSEKDLAKIRIKSKNSTFYSALTSYVGVGDELITRIKDFLNQLADLRKFATAHRISELIWSIYARTNLLEIMKKSNQR